MTDRELLELAAKAAGIDVHIDATQWGRFWVNDGGFWNPLTDDGDALRLAVKLEIAVNPYAGKTVVANDDIKWFGHEKWDCHDGDPLAATRRAIVRAAAEIGRSKE